MIVVRDIMCELDVVLNENVIVRELPQKTLRVVFMARLVKLILKSVILA